MINNPNSKPRIVYVLGYGRSGSTLLGRCLARINNTFDAGELGSYSTTVDHKKQKCSCGETIVNCQFWQQVDDDLNQAQHSLSRLEAQKLRQETEYLSSIFRWIFRRNKDSKQRYGRYLNCLFKSIQRISGCELIIDSSKTAYRAAWRALMLTRYTDCQVNGILLIRSCPAVVYSVMRGSNRDIESNVVGRKQPDTLTILRGIMGWWLANISAAVVFRSFSRKNRMVVRYEQLTGNPQDEVKKLCRFLDCDDINIMSNPVEDRPMGENDSMAHSFGGNRMRQTKKLEIRTDEEWKSGLNVLQKLVCRLADLPIRFLFFVFGIR